MDGLDVEREEGFGGREALSSVGSNSEPGAGSGGADEEHVRAPTGEDVEGGGLAVARFGRDKEVARGAQPRGRVAARELGGRGGRG